MTISRQIWLQMRVTGAFRGADLHGKQCSSDARNLRLIFDTAALLPGGVVLKHGSGERRFLRVRPVFEHNTLQAWWRAGNAWHPEHRHRRFHHH